MSSPRSIERDLSAPSATAVAPRLPRLPRGAWLPAVLLLGAVVVSSAIYLSRLGREFVFDDFATIVSNTGIRTLARGVRAFGLSSVLGQGRPLTNLTFALDLAAWGLDPRPFHATSVAFHVAATFGVFALFGGILRSARAPRALALAAVVAGTFALHPLAAEAVCYASQRSEVIASCLLLATVALLLAADSSRTGERRWVLAAGAALVMLAGLAAKSIAMVAPAAFVLHRIALPRPADLPPLRRASRAFATAAPTWAMSLATVYWNFRELGPGASAGPYAAGGLGPWRYFLTQTRVHWLYVRLLAWPQGQSIDHAVEPSPGLAHLPTLASLAAIALLLGFASILWTRAERGQGGSAHRAAAFGIGWWLLLLAPTSSIMPIDDLAAEHRTYLASAGLLVALAVATDALLARAMPRRRGAMVGIAAALLVWAALSAALLRRVEVWGSEAAVWADAARYNPESSRIANNLGFGLHRKGDLAGAEAAYLRGAALARKKDDIVGASRNLAALKLTQGQPAASMAALEPGLRVSPHDFELLVLRARALNALGRLEEALADARQAAASAPASPQPHALLGALLLQHREAVEALAQLERAVEIDPADIASSWRRVAALALSGRVGEACALWSSLGGKRVAPPQASEALWAASWLGCKPE